MAALNGFKSLRQTITLFRTAKAFYRAPRWQNPITQQTIGEFFRDINYFDQPKTSIDIGLIQPDQNQQDSDKKLKPDSPSKILNDLDEVDGMLGNLAKEQEAPPLNLTDCCLSLDKIVDLAQYYGIYRDLFGTYTPDRNEVSFTQDQASRMARFIPHYWITDQPRARVKRNQPEPDPMMFFRPYLNISARFVQTHDNESHQGHAVYYGNHIAAADAFDMPSITLDGKLLSQSNCNDKLVQERDFNNWVGGSIETVNFENNFNGYLTIALVNLDSFLPNTGLLHWMVTNIKPGDDSSNPKQVCEYLPVHGIRGFGFSRYVFIAFKHDDRLNLQDQVLTDFEPARRKFDAIKFMENHKTSNIVPVGLSWFQSTWDHSSNEVFHEYFKMKAPEYEHVQTKLEDREDQAYPGRVPFNIYLDHRRNKKDINEQVLLERLKTVDPFNYKDQYVPSKLPESVFMLEPNKLRPSWMYAVNFKKHNKIGYWRGLRPASATLPLNNNADLDKPMRPLESIKKTLLDEPNQYIGRYRKKMIRDTPMAKPANEHEAVFIQDDNEQFLDEVKQIVDDIKSDQNKIKKKSQG